MTTVCNSTDFDSSVKICGFIPPISRKMSSFISWITVGYLNGWPKSKEKVSLVSNHMILVGN